MKSLIVLVIILLALGYMFDTIITTKVLRILGWYNYPGYVPKQPEVIPV